MRYGKAFLILLTILFLTAAMACWTQEPDRDLVSMNREQPFSVLVSADGETETIHCWEQQEGTFFVFLPSYARMTQTCFSEVARNVTMDGIALTAGMDCGAFALDTAYPLEYAGQSGTVTFVQSRKVPSMHIDLNSGSLEQLHASKEHEEPGKLRLYDASGNLDHGGSLDAISGRGNSTWDQAKKPYNLKLSAQADLLDMGSAEKWVLIANYTDKSHLRNKIVFDFAQKADLAYSPESRWVDLYLNGEYQGLYLLCEKNELHPQRVNLSEDSSFLVSMEVLWRLKAQEYPHFVTESDTALRVHHGDPAVLAAKWQSVENAVLAEDGIDPVTGKSYTELIDLDSWVRKFLVEEIFGNGDASALSQFFYGDTGDGLVYAGPVWDYDVSMGLDIWQMSVPNAFYANRPYLRKGVETNWFHALYQKEAFRQQVVALYRQELRPLMEALLDTGIDAYAAQVSVAAQGNALRWSTSGADEETARIQAYLTQRLAFLDSIWLEQQEYCLVTVDLADGSNAACFVIAPGDTVPLLPDYMPDSTILGWYDLEKDVPFDPQQPIYEDTIISLKRIQPEGQEEIPQQPQPAETISYRKAAIPFLSLLGILAGMLLLDRIRRR